MKTYYKYFFILFLILSSCTSTNKIFIQDDPYKEKTTVKLNQTMKGYSDERSKKRRKFPDYYLTFKYYFSASAVSNLCNLDIKLSTSVRAYDIEPALYLSVNKDIIKLDANSNVLKMYQQGGSSTSSETSTNVSEDPENEDEEIVETTTTYTTSSSHNTYQLMQLRFNPDLALLQKISEAKKVSFRLYIDNEAIDIPLRKRDHLKFKKYIQTLEKLSFLER